MTGPPMSVGRPTAGAPGGRPALPPAGSVTDDDRRQTSTDTSEQNNTGQLGRPVTTLSTAGYRRATQSFNTMSHLKSTTEQSTYPRTSAISNNRYR